jgi:hypothetical protein
MSIISDATMKEQAVLDDPAQIEKAIKFITALKEKVPHEKGSSGNGLCEKEGD